MKYLFLILVGYAVRCEDVGNNYFVVEMPEDDPQQDLKDCKKPFQVYWNVPTMQCASKKILFQDLYEKYGIIQNDNDRFIGEKTTILYEPGDFPAIFKNETSGKYRLRNGGVPQEGELEKHIAAFKNDLNISVPDPDFDGLGIIDFESWRPVFRQNFGSLVPYKDVSTEIEKQLHWWWTKSMIQAEATRRFEAAARKFMQTTLSTAKQLRPKAVWGFYGFPYCFNMASNNLKEACANNVPDENTGIYWLWSESTALFPSIYSSASLSSSQLSSLINGRVQESVRVRVNNTPVLPYFWFKYRDDGFMSQGDLSVALSTLYKSKASGFIIWGSSNDVNTLDKCNKLYTYVETILGPNVAKYTKRINKINDDNEIDTTTFDSPTLDVLETVEDTTASTRTGQLDPEFDWMPPKNYSEDISQQVDEELSKKGFNKTINDEYKVLNQGAVIDLIIDALINAQSNMGNKNVRETKMAVNDNIESIFTETDRNMNDLLVTEYPDLLETTESTVFERITNKYITSTEYNTSNENLYISKETTIFTNDGSTAYNEVSYEGIDKNDTNNVLTSTEDQLDYSIKGNESQNFYNSNKSEDVEDTSDYLIIIQNTNNEETTEYKEFLTSQLKNTVNDDFRETTEDLDQVVTYLYNN